MEMDTDQTMPFHFLYTYNSHGSHAEAYWFFKQDNDSRDVPYIDVDTRVRDMMLILWFP